MTELYSFLFCLGLGLTARFLFIGVSALCKRTNILPVTIVLDTLFVLLIGGAFTAYVILMGAEIAPYMFAALFSGYIFTYYITRKKRKSKKAENSAE